MACCWWIPATLRLRETLLAEIRKLSGEPVRFIINTSMDADHIGSNEVLLKPSRTYQLQAEVALFAQDNVLQRESRDGSGVPSAVWPTLTYLDGKSIIFNGEAVQMLYEKAAHTDGDSVVLFRGSNVLSAGDIFLTTGYPVIDLERGGSIQGEILALNHILDLTVPRSMQEGGTMVIPGHGRLCDESEVTDYRDMLTIIRDRVQDLLRKGKTLEEVKAAKAEPRLRSALQHQRVDRRHVRRSHLQELEPRGGGRLEMKGALDSELP